MHAAKLIHRAIPDFLVDVPEARLAFAIINTACNEALQDKVTFTWDKNKNKKYVDNHLVMSARKFLNKNDKGFCFWVNCLGINPKWAFKIIEKELVFFDANELVKYFSFVLFLENVLLKMINNIDYIQLAYFYNNLAKKIGLPERKIKIPLFKKKND